MGNITWDNHYLVSELRFVMASIRGDHVWWPEPAQAVEIDWENKLIRAPMVPFQLHQLLKDFWKWDDFPLVLQPQNRKWRSQHDWEVVLGTHPHWKRLFPV